MSEEMVISLAEKGVYTTLVVCGPLLAIALIIGVIVSVFQAATQIQEQTLAFIPKIVGILLGLVFLGPWMLSHMLSYTKDILMNLTQYIG
ncbi:flagellar biosynthesis protein FliQ [Heyndrickxia ginsengihumi]|uniref:Flagellar biosynthetic protein FliQ n=1 Tax=Heyndrickxia ginsengihumi TaxID=363870 RepID=A0A0A6VIP6_9BACI|nr:flagellar biosynthesis protein FliQ [Heyndrickxia ginsengihumi]KHD86514.1 flagellar biosynthesis protein FliQ [Heyndrickxia ginsengihumi]MBE6182767.1 flagellar biosynthesis protein FliQ [Bacillus sp. (in: firmicutes)]MCM3022507.1 flagellar biosynthesis protein FliQ [Heyndrickxia ginsengihumi]NEY19627.1 flagellar biosynthesis protein FliQ [Heyndrickxia ginsengihumi]